MKYQVIVGICALTGALVGASAAVEPSLGLEDIEFWTGSGTNRAALVIEWKQPEVLNNTALPSLSTQKTLAWGYRWDGECKAVDLFNAVVAADPRLFAVLSEDIGYGSMIMGLGYDLNNNRVYGIRNGTTLCAYSELSNSDAANGIFVAGYNDADVAESLDPADLYWGGVYGPYWELWHEAGGQGGFTQMPSTGKDLYWIADPHSLWSGSHGQWSFATGISSTDIFDGSWIAFSISAGGLDYANPTAPGTVAFYEHKSAPHSAEAAPSNQSPYPMELSDSHGPFSKSALYGDPLAALGEPTIQAQDLAFFGDPTPFHVKLAEAAYNTDIDGNNVLVTLEKGTENGEEVYGSLTVKFDHPVVDDPANPYGIDFEVFGNTFYVGKGFVSDTTDMRTFQLTGSAFEEPMLVSVSLDGENWYTYKDGPYCDSVFPTQGFQWSSDLFDETGCGWTKEKMDFTKPVNPALSSVLGTAGSNLTGVDAIKLYAGSGGGTGFDLKESGFSSIQYIRVEAASGYVGGELDAFSDVRPALVGEGLTVAPTNGAAEIFFQNPAETAETLLKIQVEEVSAIAFVKPIFCTEPMALGLLEADILAAFELEAAPVLSGEPLEWKAALELSLGARYQGEGSDLELYCWKGEECESVSSFSYDSARRLLSLGELPTHFTFAVAQMKVPSLEICLKEGELQFSFTPKMGWVHTLEYTSDFAEWKTLEEFTPTEVGAITLTEKNISAGRTFYRLRLTKCE